MAEIIYLCINCKREWFKLPLMEGNECTNGYYHRFVKKLDIISNINRGLTKKEIDLKNIACENSGLTL